jgi:pseudouridine-5'-phosphate glycosidase
VSAAVELGDDVSAALAAGRGVVALETSVIGQGLPPPENDECVRRMSEAVRSAGAVPGWVGVLDGSVRLGLSPDELARFLVPGAATKVARRDLPVAVASGALGATTVSATVWAAGVAGIAVAATGGIGGVHHGPVPDVSADLLELARTPVLLVCSGPKSVIDPAATAERLEELGVAIVGYGVDRLPFFLARDAGVDLEHRADTPEEVAAMGRSLERLGARSAIVVCNPVPEPLAMDAGEVAAASRACEERAAAEGIGGKALTPFLLSCLASATGGRSLRTNLGLLEDNARLAGEVAATL